MASKKFKEPWQILKLILKSTRRDEWVIDINVDKNIIKFSIKDHDKMHWLLFDFDRVMVQNPNQGFEIDLMALANPIGDPYHLVHDKFGAGDQFNPNELHLLRSLYEICKVE